MGCSPLLEKGCAEIPDSGGSFGAQHVVLRSLCALSSSPVYRRWFSLLSSLL